jgi:hypothetical protein
VYYRRTALCYAFFFVDKRTQCKGFLKKCLLFMVGSVYRVKRFTNWVDTFSQRGSKVVDYARPGEEMAETTVKILLCCGFRRASKAMGQVYQCWWRICREIKVFSRFDCHTFYVLYPFVTYLLTLPRNNSQ